MQDRPASLEQTIAAYAQISNQYLKQRSDRTSIQAWLDRFQVVTPPGSVVLDLGSGPGFDLPELQARGYMPIGLDLSMPMMRTGMPRFSGPRVQADALRIPLASQSLGGIWANAALVHLDPEAALGVLLECHRVLRDTGTMHVSVKAGTGGAWDHTQYNQRRWYYFWRDSEWDQCLARARFEIIELRDEVSTRGERWLVRLLRRLA